MILFSLTYRPLIIWIAYWTAKQWKNLGFVVRTNMWSETTGEGRRCWWEWHVDCMARCCWTEGKRQFWGLDENGRWNRTRATDPRPRDNDSKESIRYEQIYLEKCTLGLAKRENMVILCSFCAIMEKHSWRELRREAVSCFIRPQPEVALEVRFTMNRAGNS